MDHKISISDLNLQKLLKPDSFLTSVEDESEVLIASRNPAQSHPIPHHFHFNQAQDDSLVIPLGLVQKNLETSDISLTSRQSQDLSNELLGLPGNLTLNSETTNKYFGPVSRQNFFDRYKWMNSQHSRLTTSMAKSGKILLDHHKSSHIAEQGTQASFGIHRGLNRPSDFTRSLNSISSLSSTKKSRKQLPSLTSPYSLESISSPTSSKSVSSSLTKSSVILHPTPLSPNSLDTRYLPPVLLSSPIEHSTLLKHKKKSTLPPPVPVSVPVLAPIPHPSPLHLDSDLMSELTLEEMADDLYTLYSQPGPSLSEVEEEEGELDDDEEDALSLSHLSHLLSSGEGEALQPMSPRSKYLSSCLLNRLNPRANLIVRKKLTKRLDISHQGIGDHMGGILSSVLADLPFLQAVDLQDNNLSDLSLEPLFSSLMKIPNLLEINLSHNEMGRQSSLALSRYLSKAPCSLKRLVLRSSNIDDSTGAQLITSLARNSTLTEIDLSKNKLGASEAQNALKDSSILTAAESLADLLQTSYCFLTRIELGWNMIRMKSGEKLCHSLSMNTSVTYLDLSYNSLGGKGAVELGTAIMDNSTLHTLILTANSVDFIGVSCLCAGLIINPSIRKIVLDENPIGEQGARALMVIATIVGSRVDISANRCNVHIKDDTSLLDLEQLTKDYLFRLDQKVDRCLLIFLLHIIASHSTYLITKFESQNDNSTHKRGKGKTKVEESFLVSFLVQDKNKYFEEEEISFMNKTREHIAIVENEEAVLRAAHQWGLVGPDSLITESQFESLLGALGLEVDQHRQRELFQAVDLDETGHITQTQFMQFIRSHKNTLISILRDHTHAPVFGISGMASLQRYFPPSTGNILLSVRDGFKLKDVYRIITKSDLKNITILSKTFSGDCLTSQTYAFSTTKMRLEEALQIFQTMMIENGNIVKILTSLIPRLAFMNESRTLLSRVVNYNRDDLLNLRRSLGARVRPLMGQYTGYYQLDLSLEEDRRCLAVLSDHSIAALDKQRLEARLPRYLPDLSQRGSRVHLFRNEYFNHVPFKITRQFLMSTPKVGILQFDFVIRRVPTQNCHLASDLRVLRTLIQNFLLPSHKAHAALRKIKRLDSFTSLCANGNGQTLYECGSARSRDIQAAMSSFYDHLPQRPALRQEASRKEAITAKLKSKTQTRSQLHVPPVFISDQEFSLLISGDVNLNCDKNYGQSTVNPQTSDPFLHVHRSHIFHEEPPPPLDPHPHPTNTQYSSKSNLSRKSILSIGTSKPDPSHSGRSNSLQSNRSSFSVISESHEHLDSDSEVGEKDYQSDPEDSQGQEAGQTDESIDTSLSEFEKSELRRVSRPDRYLCKFKELLLSPSATREAKCMRLVEVLDEALKDMFLRCSHLALILELLAMSCSKKRTPHFGSYRVEVVVSLYERVVDPENLHLALRVLDGFEVGCVFCRLGVLNFFNPLRPEGNLTLDMSVPEERTLVKILYVLAVKEPGENWVSPEFRWSRSDPPIPGWQLTSIWGTEGGLPVKGVLSVGYSSGEGQRLRGCAPLPSLRWALLDQVGLEERAVRTRGGEGSGDQNSIDQTGQAHKTKSESDKFFSENIGQLYYTLIDCSLSLNDDFRTLDIISFERNQRGNLRLSFSTWDEK